MRLLRFLAPLICALSMWASPASAQGTIPIALQQSVNSVGQPLAGCLLYIFQSGTVATPQNSFSDTGLTQVLPNPLQCDQNGRLPMFYLANGSVHVRLTDASGVVQFDYPSMLVIGQSGGTAPAQSFDPTAIPVTGDVKFRPTTDILSGWVKLNATTIGSASSGATQLASATAQALYVYLWGVCNNAHCAVSSGRGANGLADFNANKTLTVPDLRSRVPLGLANMASSQPNCNSRSDCITNGNVTSGGGDTNDTAFATGGSSNTILAQGNLPSVTLPITSEPTITLNLNLVSNSVSNSVSSSNSSSNSSTSIGINDPGHTHTYTQPATQASVGLNGGGSAIVAVPSVTGGIATGSSTTGITLTNTGITTTTNTTTNTTTTTTTTTADNGSAPANSGGSVALGGSGNSFGNISDFMLGTWYMKL